MSVLVRAGNKVIMNQRRLYDSPYSLLFCSVFIYGSSENSRKTFCVDRHFMCTCSTRYRTFEIYVDENINVSHVTKCMKCVSDTGGVMIDMLYGD